MAARTTGFSGKNGNAYMGAGDVTHGTLYSSAYYAGEVVKWSFDPKTNIAKYASNITQGFKSGVAGTRDGSGKVECKVRGGSNKLKFQDGDPVTLELHVDATGSNYFLIPAIVEGTPVACDIDGGEAVTVEFNFQTDGPWTANGILAKS